MPEQKALSEMTELKKCLRKLEQTEEGYYKVSSLPELAAVLRKLQEEKARQGGFCDGIPVKEKRTGSEGYDTGIASNMETPTGSFNFNIV